MESKSCFERLSFAEKINYLQTVAEKAKARWDNPPSSKLTLINFTENATYRLEVENKTKMIMRVQRLDYTTLDSVKTELSWIAELRRTTNLSLNCPLLSRNRKYVEVIESPEMNEKRLVVCFKFIEGQSPADSSDANDDIGGLIRKIDWIPDTLTIPVFKLAALVQQNLGHSKKSTLQASDRQLYRKVGKIAATLHTRAIEWKDPDFFERMEWNFDGTFGKNWNNFYGVSYRSRQWLSQKDISIIDQCVDLIKKRVEAYGKAPDRYGMIHSDLRMANMLKNGDEITVLDFDDCGKGWFMYDIASVVTFMEHRTDLSEVIKELIGGYELVRKLSDEDKQEIGTFIMMRRIGMLQSLISRIGSVIPGSGESQVLTPEVLAFYAKGTAILAKKYLKNFASRPDLTAIPAKHYRVSQQ
ncbi:phosphotransferase enzyme family protein [Sporolactobacillus kofuensis]|uniref:Phosphotransferase enzyme family protein n=1 Tax=Sporolactobacillus kofuensis TaxID=269672 RepID=A0ABW1WE25_9BACL|nr:phosphotransferase [Sporolactobacillus kofuensis]MCO7175760.1 phosphotransferase [Sporolactobacillus kofuensis]